MVALIVILITLDFEGPHPSPLGLGEIADDLLAHPYFEDVSIQITAITRQNGIRYEVVNNSENHIYLLIGQPPLVLEYFGGNLWRSALLREIPLTLSLSTLQIEPNSVKQFSTNLSRYYYPLLQQQLYRVRVTVTTMGGSTHYEHDLVVEFYK